MNKVIKKFAQDILGLLWLGLGLLAALSLYSYSPLDPSLNSLGSTEKVLNYCGYFGSFFADLIFQGLGLAGWIIPLAALWLSYNFFNGKSQLLKIWKLSLFTGLLLNVSSLLTIAHQKTALNLSFNGGGAFGLLLSQTLTQILNTAGVLIFLLTFLLILLVFYFERSISDLIFLPARNLLPFVLFCYREACAGFRASMSWSRASRGVRESDAAVETVSTDRKRKIFAITDHEIEREKKPEARFKLEKPLGEGSEVKFQVNSAEARVTERKKKTTLKMNRSKTEGPWVLPELELLDTPPRVINQFDEKEAKAKAQLLLDKLAQFAVRADVVGIKPGPAVTLFEVKPAADVKISKITDLADDLSLALSCESLRMIAPIPGRDVIGIETSNSQRQNVYLKDVLQDESFWSDEVKLPIALGRQADGEPQVVDLRKMPHLLVAGTTGSGKSVFVVSSLVGLLLRHSPETLRLVLVDPKQVDLAIFNELPHLLMPPVRDPKKAVGALRWAIREMEKRYRSMSKFGARGIEVFNQMMSDLSQEEKEHHQNFLDTLNSDLHPESYYLDPQPYIVIVVEEFGDLMAVDKANVEQSVVRLAQMARASGIHLILAMQSPRRDVVTGLIKTNIPGRISFKVASKTDSRIILDESGAERLLARGDMLFLAPGVSKPLRNHGAYLSEEEIGRVVEHWKAQGEPNYHPIASKLIDEDGINVDGAQSDLLGDDDEIKDERYDEILAYVASQKEMSASLLQRRFRLGYPRAARMIEIFESEGVVGPAQGSKPRKVLISSFAVVPDERL